MEIQKLGLEIRKIGSLNNLYKDIDRVLNNYSIKHGEVNANVQALAVAHSLQKMLSVDKYCDVCCIKECAKMCQICISCERMQIYQTQHCIYWKDMLPDFRQMLFAMILDDFRSILNPS